jgi:hypothetical protein
MTKLRSLFMIALALLAIAVTMQPAQAVPSRDEILRMVVQEAMRSRTVPPALALAVAQAESNFDADANSSAGARGVMQIMPRTGRDVFDVDPDALWEPRLNIQLGIKFLERLIERYDGHWDLALSHYNGGSRVGKMPGARVIPATQAYVDKVLRLYRRYERDATVAELTRELGDASASLRLAHADQDKRRCRVKALRVSGTKRFRFGKKRSGNRPAGETPPHVGPDWRPDRDWLTTDAKDAPGATKDRRPIKWRSYMKTADAALEKVEWARSDHKRGRMTTRRLINSIKDRKRRFRDLLREAS